MSNSSVFVTFGANSSELEASIAQIKAALRGYTSDLAEVARAQAKAGDSAAVEMGDKLLAAAAKVSEAKSQLRGFQEQLKEIGTGATSGAKAAAEEMNAALQGVASGGVAGTSGHGVGPGFYAREAHALLDELSSGRLQQAQGTFTNVAFTFLQGHQALIPYAAAALALGGAFAFLAIHVAEANAAIQSIRLDAAANAFQLSAEQATKLRDSIKELAGVSDSNAAAIAKPFAALGTVGGTVAELLAPSMKALAQSLNGDVGMAAEQVAQRFTDLDGAGRNFVDNLRGLTQGERDHFAQLVATGKETQAYALLIDLSARSLESLAGKRKIEAAAAIDQAAALQDAALAGGDMKAAEAHMGEAVAEATGKLADQNAKLLALHGQLLAASSAADTFQRAMSAALKVDKVAAGMKETQDTIDRLQAGLAVAPDHATAATNELGHALDLARDKLKAMRQQQGDPGGLGRDLLQQDQDALTHFDNTWRGKEQGRLQGHIAMLSEMLASDRLNAQQRFKLQQDLESSQKSLFDSQSKGGEKAAKDVLGANLASLEGQIRALGDHTRAMLDHRNAQVKLKEITEDAKAAAAIKALGEEQKAVDALFARELELAGLPLTKKQEIGNKKTQFDDRNALEIQQAMEKAAEATQKTWDNAFKEINSAFDSQISELLKGTTSWREATRNVLATLTEDIAKFFVHWGLEAAEKFAKDQIFDQARVVAHVGGNAAIAASDAASASAGGFAWAGAALKAIAADAAQAFAGVFAFFAPILGPAAAGPAAAASGTVLAAGAAIASADIGMWSVPSDMLTLVHHNELIMPAAQAGAFRDLLAGGGGGRGSSVAIHPTVNIQTSAVDGASVAQFWRAICGRPHGKHFFCALNDLVSCGHMSGLLSRDKCPLALMKSDDRVPYQSDELFAHVARRAIPNLRW